jgi:hypothetical protein
MLGGPAIGYVRREGNAIGKSRTENSPVEF